MKRERYDRERKTAGWPLLSFHSAAAVGLTGNQRLQVSEETILFSQTQHTAQPKKKKRKTEKKGGRSKLVPFLAARLLPLLLLATSQITTLA